MKKILIFVGILLAVTALGLGGYWLYREITSKNEKLSEQTKQIEDKDKEVSALKGDLENYKLLVEQYKSKEEEVKDPYFGWKTYESSKYKISFKYPSGFSIEDNKDQGILEVLAVHEDEYGGTILVKKPVVIFSPEHYYLSYDDKETEMSKHDIKSVKIGDKVYKTAMYSMGEGGPGGFNITSFYTLKYTNATFVAINTHGWGSTEDDCNDTDILNSLYEGDKQECLAMQELYPATKYATSTDTLNKAKLIVESIKSL